jgi:murein DD-endopeptidase MepM/ murein hydrolase activator NlpD
MRGNARAAHRTSRPAGSPVERKFRCFVPKSHYHPAHRRPHQATHRRKRRTTLPPELRVKGAAGIAGAAICVAAGVQAVASPSSKEVATQAAGYFDKSRQASDALGLGPVRAARAEAGARSSRANARPAAVSAADALNDATRQAAQQAAARVAAELAAQAEAARIAAEQAAAAEAARKAAEEAARAEAAKQEAAKKEAAAAGQTAAQPKATGWVLPLKSYRITATFGQSGSNWSSTHTGLDMAAPSGTPVMAANSGTVGSAGSAGAYGNRIVIKHDDGTETWYCHLSSFSAQAGQQVGAGEVIGKVGSTGNTTGPHLHLEVRVGGNPVDPRSFLAKRGVAP